MTIRLTDNIRDVLCYIDLYKRNYKYNTMRVKYCSPNEYGVLVYDNTYSFGLVLHNGSFGHTIYLNDKDCVLFDKIYSMSSGLILN